MNCLALTILLIAAAAGGTVTADETGRALERRIGDYLDAHTGTWRDMNVPGDDGRVLYDIIVEHGYTRALEIGTSTGHSGLWIARALALTGGTLVTVEIDEDRHREALEHFRAAGADSIVDARLADAHELVPELAGPFDFVFIDADKDWYVNYFEAVLPKMKAGGCITAHNVLNRYMPGIRAYLDRAGEEPGVETEINRASRSGIAVSYIRPRE